MDSVRRSRKKNLRNREISIKMGSVTKAKKRDGNREKRREEKKIKKRISLLNSEESPGRESLDRGIDDENLAERSSTTLIEQRSGKKQFTVKAIIEKSPVRKNLFGRLEFGDLVETVGESTPSPSKRSSFEDPSIQLVHSATGDKNYRTSNIDEILIDNESGPSSIGSKSPDAQNLHENIEMEDNQNEKAFMENVWMQEVRKDIATLYGAYHAIVHDVKQIKKYVMTKNRDNRSISPLSVASSLDDDSKFFLLPKFQLKKVKRIVEMETSINSNHEYKKQLIKKFATFGGSTIKQTVINIFNGIFTKKLKTKVCWEGTQDKASFRQFTGLRDVLRQAVKGRFKCNRHDIDKECKLRFNQAQKDYDREKQRKTRRREYEYEDED